MYIPVVSETCRAMVLASQIIFLVMACAKVVWREEQCYEAIRKCIKGMFFCEAETAAKFIPILRTVESVGLVSWAIWLTQPKM